MNKIQKNMVKSVIIVQARMESSRLPRKVMIELAGKPVLWHVVERCKKADVDGIVVATSINKENDEIEEFCKKYGYTCFRGSENDVLDRYYRAAKKYHAEIIIRITGDCPLVDPFIINKFLEEFKSENYDYVSNLFERTFPRGLDAEVFSFKALELAHRLSSEKAQREHVTAFIYGNKNLFKVKSMVASGYLRKPEIRLTIDTNADYALLKNIYDNLYGGKPIEIENVMEHLEKNPELAEINKESELEHLERNKMQKIEQKIVKNSIVIETPLGKREIGPGNPIFIVAEMSGNHNKSFEKAIDIIDAAAKAGADAIKLQTYTPDTLTIDCDNEYFKVKVNDAWAGKKLYDLYKEAYTPWEWQPKLKEYAESRGLVLFSTPFDESAVDFLEKMNVQLYKVASFEIGHLPLLRKIGKTGKPVIISRGLASEEDIVLAIKTLKESGCPQVAVLHCISSYPAKAEQMNLSTIPDLEKRFNVFAGLSDHTLGTTVALTSVAFGASIIEKHFTISRAEKGPDSAFSLEPKELKELVESIREAEKAIGKPTYDIGDKEAENIVFKRSIFSIVDIKKGDKLNKENIRIIRPGYGLPAKHFDEIVGKVAKQDIPRGTPLKWELIE